MRLRAWVLVALVLPGMACAAAPAIESSMRVAGTITVNPDGSVAGYTIRDADGLPPAVREIVQTTVPGWQFDPITVDGEPVSAKAGMELRIVADRPSPDAERATIRVADAVFGCEARRKALLPGECPKGTTVVPTRQRPPRYPVEAMRARVGGEALMVIEIGRDGRVTRVAPRQVNLFRQTERPARYRRAFADAAATVMRTWRFRIPTVGKNATRDHWIVTIPVNYFVAPPVQTGTHLRARGTHAYGKWRTYVPGPVQAIPWDDRAQWSSVGGNGLFVNDDRFVLKTALNGGS